MKARPPGVSAVLFEEYACGVSASSSTSMHSVSNMLLVPHATRAISVGASPLPKFLTLLEFALILP
jgi:hypothetical protein